MDKDGKGKEKNIIMVFLGDLEIKFEGEYKNREKAGIGKEFNNNKKLVYEGEFLKGECMKKEKNMMNLEI